MLRKRILNIMAVMTIGLVLLTGCKGETNNKQAVQDKEIYQEHLTLGEEYLARGEMEKAIETFEIAKNYYEYSGEAEGAYMKLLNIKLEQDDYEYVKKTIEEIDLIEEIELSPELKTIMDEERNKEWFLISSQQIIYENEDADIEGKIIDYHYYYDDTGKIVKTNDVNFISKYTSNVDDGEIDYTVKYDNSDILLYDEDSKLKYKAAYNGDRVESIQAYNENGNIRDTMSEDEYCFYWDEKNYVTETHEYYEEWYQELIDEEKYLKESFSNSYDVYGNLVSRTHYFGEVSQLTLSNYTGMAHLSPAKKDELESKAKEIEGCALSERRFQYIYCNIEDLYVEGEEKNIITETSVGAWGDFLGHYCRAEKNGFPEDTEGINYMFILYGCNVPLEYAVVDLAGDDDPELLISGDGIIYDIFYFLQGEGQVCPLITSEINMPYETWLGDRAKCYIYEDGIVRIDLDINDMSQQNTYYKVQEGTSELMFVESMCVSDGSYYFCNEQGAIEKEVSENEYYSFLTMYDEKNISWTKLSDFNE